MATNFADPKSRRQFLKMLAMSPALASLHLPSSIMKELQQTQSSTASQTQDVLHVQDPDGVPASVLKSMEDFDNDLASAKDALTVFDLEAVARRKLNPGHLAFLLGSESGGTYMANRQGFDRFALRPRRLRNIRNVDISTTLFGVKWDTPIFLSPVGSQTAFNPEGEIATARGAKTKKHLMLLSDNPIKTYEEISEARGMPLWTQLSWSDDWSVTLGRIKRAEAGGCPAIFVSVDTPMGDKREALARVRRQNAALCGTCHTLIPNEGLTQKALAGPGFQTAVGSIPFVNAWKDTKPVGPSSVPPVLSWDWVKKVRDSTKMKLVIKGIEVREDAELAVQHGVDCVFVSTHGGHAENNVRGSIDWLPEVIAGVAGRVPVLVDSGFRRGGDIYKALAMGATAVGVGRPYIWGLAAFGQDGVEASLDILTTELRMVMKQMGATSIKSIDKGSVVPARA